MDGKWEAHDVKTVYDNEWMHVDVADVELPDGKRVEHHLIRPRSSRAVGALCYDPEKGVLVIWRHRFIVDRWGWEFPAGGVDENESPAKAAERECLEETGWKPNKLTSFLKYAPAGGIAELEFECLYSEGATWVGPGRDTNEATDLAWISIDQLRTFIRNGEMSEGLSLTAALYALQFGPLAGK